MIEKNIIASWASDLFQIGVYNWPKRVVEIKQIKWSKKYNSERGLSAGLSRIIFKLTVFSRTIIYSKTNASFLFFYFYFFAI